MSPFCTTFITDYLHVNPDSTITLPRLMAYAQESSLLHGNYAGYPIEWFSEQRHSFILTHWQAEITAYPKWNRPIHVKTWPSKMRGFIAERAFVITDEYDNTLLRANSNWIYMDLDARKPSRIPLDMSDNYGPQAPPALSRDYKLSDFDLSQLQVLGKHAITVTRREIDTNLHVNNQKYLEWALDYIPDAVYQSRQLVAMKIHYKKECVKDQTVLVETCKKITDVHQDEEFISLIRDATQEDVILTEVWSRWR